MRTLKTKFPCKTCGTPTEVARLRDGPGAMCDTCAERERDNLLINGAHRAGDAAIAKVNGRAEGVELAAGWLRGLSEHVKGLARRMEAMPRATPSTRRLLAKGAGEWLAWTIKQLASLEPLVAEAFEDSSFDVVAGGGEVGGPPPTAVTLRLVRAPKEDSNG